jgi:hypothetical protein
MSRKRWVVVPLALVLLAGACSDDSGDESADEPTTTTTAAGSGASTTTTVADDGLPDEEIVFGAEGNRLWAYSTGDPSDTQVVIPSNADDPEAGLDINAQICFFPDGSGRFIAGEDTHQPDPPAGWGIFQLSGTGVGDLEAEEIGKLTPTYQSGADPENYGCGILSDGRMLTTDLGGQAPGDPGNGQFIVWFGDPEGTDQTYCKVDIAVATAQSILVLPDDSVLVVSARPPSSGVWRYTDLPTSADAAGGCGATDSTGAPMADEVHKEQVLAPGQDDILSPAGIAFSPAGGYYLSSVITGIINEYDEDWNFVRQILAPPSGEAIGADTSLSTGTPLGIGVTSDGTIWYADIGIVNDPENGFGPGDGTGTVRRIAFADDEPQAPETVNDGLAFPDGIGVYQPGGAVAGAPSPA